MKLLNSLANLTLQPDWFNKHGRKKDASDECRSLLKLAAKLRERKTDIERQPPLNPDEVWLRWSRSGFGVETLDARQIRTLCVSSTTATKPQVIQACIKRPDILARTGCLIGLINAYFIDWGDIDHQSEIEALIRSSLSKYSKKNPVIGHFKSHSEDLFSPKGPPAIAKTAIEKLRPIRESIKENYVSVNSRYARAVISASIRAYIAYFIAFERRAREGDCIGALSYAIRELLVDESPRLEFCALTEALIMSPIAQNSEAFQKQLREFVMTHDRLGDPRLPKNIASWAMMKQEAGSRFLGWLAKDSILFFFNYILPNNDKNRRRKDFWLEYHEKVRDFQVALSDDDHRRLQAYSRQQDVPSFSRVNHPTASAFLMRFGDEGTGHYVVEFSETGNAAYVFKAQSFKASVGSIRRSSFELKDELKNDSKLGRIIHSTGQWEYKARQQLAVLGIRKW